MNKYHWKYLAAVSAVFLCLPAVVTAQTNTGSSKSLKQDLLARPQKIAGKGTNAMDKIDVKADELKYGKETGVVEAKGNVVIKQAGQELRAQYVKYNYKTGDAQARDRVTLIRGTSVWTGPELKYNFKTGAGMAEEMNYRAAPFNLTAKKIEKQDDKTYVFTGAEMTTCSNDISHSHYSVTASKITLIQGEELRARNAVLYLGCIPIFYFPYWNQCINEDKGWIFVPGYKSRWGAFVLGTYRYPLAEYLKSRTRVDYYAKRGLGLGEDLLWERKEVYKGVFSAYYIDDKEPLDVHDTANDDIDNTRYRIKFKNTGYITDNDYTMVQAFYMSDIDVLEDYFRKEFNESAQPENYASYTHRGEKYTFLFQARGALNDFYTTVNRMPEATITFMQQEIEGTPFYYEGQGSLAYLEKVYGRDYTESDYSAFRMDSPHMFYWPTRQFGWLNVTPRAGFRATYYSQTKEEVTNAVIVQTASTNGTRVTYTTSTNNVVTTTEKGADIRAKTEIGLATSYKAFKAFGDPLDPRRHVFEPYINYTFIPEPTITPGYLYQFDDIDAINEQNSIQIGMKNKYQKKKDGQPYDILDTDIYTTFLVDKKEGQDSINNFNLWARWKPFEVVTFDFDGMYDTANSQLSTFNSRMLYDDNDLFRISLEHWFRVDQSSLAVGSLTLFPNRAWEFNAYTRYEMETSQLEEQGGYIQRKFDCITFRLTGGVIPSYTTTGGAEIEQEIRVMLEFWVNAFPEAKVSGNSTW